jgi:quercetin dioxygenase-like cupin family protein
MALSDSAEVMETVAKERFLRKSPFLEFCDAEGLPVIMGYGVEDLRTVPLSHWKRLGGPAAYCHLEGSQGFVGSMVAEIPPGENLQPVRHLYEELILILEGRGATQFWCEKTNQTILLEWQAGSLFSPPLNVKHQHFNGSATEPVRFVAPSNAPIIFNAFASPEFIFNTPYEFTDRFSGQNNYFSSEVKEGEFEDTSINFISDIYAVPLTKYPRRGVDYSRLGITGSGNKAMVGHIMAIGSGTYRKPHYHGSGAQVVVLDGKGYTLMWPKYETNEGPKPKDGRFVRVDWHKGSLLVPPEGWYHSHFTTSAEPGLHLALRRGQRGVGQRYLPTVPESQGGTVMDYEDEPREVRAIYEAELAKTGVPCRMPPVTYRQ